MSQDRPTLRKRLLVPEDQAPEDRPSGALDLAAIAMVAVSSEDAAHSVEHLLDESVGPGATHWRSARADMTEQIVFEFDQPQAVSRIIYEVEETARERTQEIQMAVSSDGGSTYRQVLVQEYTFSPAGATFQREDLRFEIDGIDRLRLTIVPNKNGSGAATLTSFRVYP